MSIMKLILGLVGEKFAGKDEIAKFLVKKYGADHVRFSHILDEILTLLNLPISRRNEVDLGLGLRKIFGDGVLGKAVEQRINNTTAHLVVVNGIRMDEMETIRALGAKIIYVTAPVRMRFARYQNRHEKVDDATMNFDQFQEQEKEPTEIGIPALGERADFKIENVGDLQELYAKVDEIMANINLV